MADYQILVPPPPRHRKAWLAAAVIAVVLAVAVGAFAFGRHTGGPDPGTHAAGGGGAKPAPTLTVVSTTPSTGTTQVPSDQVVTITFNSALSGSAGTPVFSPPVSGSWGKVGPATLAFTATEPFIPTTDETLTIPAGTSGPRSTQGARLTAPVTVTFDVAQASTERLQQLLAQLGYLPLSFTSAGTPAPNEMATAQTGTFAWRWATLPTDLTSLWIEGSENVITKGAVMTFEDQNGLTVDGLAGQRVWSALLTAVAGGKADTSPYTYADVSKQLPESLTLYENGAPTMAGIAVNTGAPGADTVDGTYPVFEHVTSSRMQGTNPDGSTYDDPAVPWASYFNGGDALHGFVRATYGSPQSNGCVEMPVATAAQVWPLTPIGTLVTVTGPAS
ncbi:MAG TPA: L,D-transpeptidase family protein [Acidimicrobiales bacterium]|nr:L,D-transpeptidase family protein [Acidimicrobiales bacterium]